ncbi:hypothetical protein KC725_05360 [Candidatus Peregrinibacteria bacterium]|nr:hypothetical protein [Candidatus Peregrinibacteria bacterium]
MSIALTIFMLACTACGDEFKAAFGDGGVDGGEGGSDATSGSTGGDGGTTCTPNDEICDGLDNDCDDEIDEELDICVSVVLEPHTDSVATLLVTDAAGKTVGSQSSEEPFGEPFTVYLDSPRTLYLRLEQPVLTVDAVAISIDMNNYGYGCSEGEVQVPLETMKVELEEGNFAKGETFLECYTNDICTVQHIQGCGNGEIHTLRLEVSPKL